MLPEVLGTKCDPRDAAGSLDEVRSDRCCPVSGRRPDRRRAEAL